MQPGWLTPLCDQLSLHSEPCTFKLLTSYFQFSSCFIELQSTFIGQIPLFCDFSLETQFLSFYSCHVLHVVAVFKPQTGEVRHISHLNFIAWPDHDTPSQPDDLLTFISYMRHVHKSGPIITHCSAGIGRSGTLICIDVILGLISRDLDVSSIPGDGLSGASDLQEMCSTRSMQSFKECAMLLAVPCFFVGDPWWGEL